MVFVEHFRVDPTNGMVLTMRNHHRIVKHHHASDLAHCENLGYIREYEFLEFLEK